MDWNRGCNPRSRFMSDYMSKGNTEVENYNGILVEKCRRLLEQQCDVEFHHVYREANKIVDWLANWVLKKALGEHFLHCPPEALVAQLEADAHGVIFPRMIHQEVGI